MRKNNKLVLSCVFPGVRVLSRFLYMSTSLVFNTFSEASAVDTCAETPIDLVVDMLPTCTITIAGTTSSSFNVRRCNNILCVTHTSTSAISMCCLPTNTHQQQVDCAGFSYPIFQIDSCGCGVCPQDNHVTVNGVVHGSGAPIADVHIMHGGIRYEVEDDLFSFEAIPEAGRIVFRVKSDAFMPQLVTLDVSEGVTQMYADVTLTPKGTPNVVSAETGGELDVATTGMSSAASVNIPPNSFQDANGDPVTGDVNVFLSYADPRVPVVGLGSAPGQFTYQDSEGETRLLETRGVITLVAEDQSGDEVFLSGTVTMEFDADALGIESGDTYFLWSIDGSTGEWQKSGEMTYTSSRRRRRQASGNDRNNTVVGETEIPPNVPYVNCDRPFLGGRLCSVAVYVYWGESLLTPLQGERLSAFIIENGVFLGRTRGYTNKDGRACLLVTCGLQHIVLLESREPVYVHPTHHLPAGFGFTNRDEGFEFTAPIVSSADGPVFSYNVYGQRCYQGNDASYHFKLAKAPLRPSLYGSLNAVEMRPGLDNSWFTNSGSEREMCVVQVEIQVGVFWYMTFKKRCF